MASLRRYLAEAEALAEAIPLGKAKKYRRAWNPATYSALFMSMPAAQRDRQGYRLYLPYEDAAPPPAPPPDIARKLRDKGYEVSDYAAGLAKQSGARRVTRIGGLLADEPELQKRFMNDPRRAGKKAGGKLVCISRHPYDIAGMSAGRGWTSCMDIGDGANRHYVMSDVKEGTLVAYLIRDDDRNIQRPMSRLLIKPFVGAENPDDILLVTDAKQYGTPDAHFAEVVEEWLAGVNGPGKKGMYCLHPDLYDDGKSVRFAGMPPDTLDGMRAYLHSIDAMPPLLEEDGNNLVLEQWGDLAAFCRQNGDETLEYLLLLRENAAALDGEGAVDVDTAQEALALMPDDLLRRLCDEHRVPHARANEAGFNAMARRLADSRDVRTAMAEAGAGGDGAASILRDRIGRYVKAGWRFKMSQCFLRVPRGPGGYALDQAVRLCIGRRDMQSYIENHMEDPDAQESAEWNELYKVANGYGDWSDMDNDDMSDWRGEYSDDPLTDRYGADLVFGTERKPKRDLAASDDAPALARAFAEALRGHASSHVPSDTRDLFDSAMRRAMRLV